MSKYLVHDAICEEIVEYVDSDYAKTIIDKSKAMLKGELMTFVRCMVDDLIFDFGLEYVETAIAKLINADIENYVRAAQMWAAGITPETDSRQVYYDKDNRALLTMCAFELMMKHYAKA